MLMLSKAWKASADTAIASRKTVPVFRRPAGPASSPSFPGVLSRIPRVAARLALAALLLAGAGAIAAPASADVLVSNLGRSDSGGNSLADHDQAQAFTTGSNDGGYTLTSVEIEFDNVAAGAAFTVSIWTESSGSPGTSLGTLTNPTLTATDTGMRDRANDVVYEFTTAGIDLAKDTTYFVVVDSANGTSATEIQDTGSDFEDSGGATGWSIANGSLQRAWNTTGSWTASDDSKKILINGTRKGDVGNEGDLRLRDATSDTNGRLEIYHDDGSGGQWRSVCGHFFSSNDAGVACRQLGYTGGRDINLRAPATSNPPFWLDDVGCTGSESRLDQCSHRGWGIHNCQLRDAAAVLCYGTNQDRRGPELVSMVAKFTKITLTFDEELDETSNPGIYNDGVRFNGVLRHAWHSGFRVSIGKGNTSWVGFITDVAIVGKQVVITMADSHTVRHDTHVRVAYRKGGPVRLQDKQGNEVTSWKAPSSYDLWGFGWDWKSAKNVTPNPAVTFDKTTLTVVEDDETGGTYTVKLTASPPAGETYYIKLFTDSVIRKTYRYSRVWPSPRVLAFTSDNWNTGVTVTVTGREPDIDDDGKTNTARIWHQEKTDSRKVTVTVTENAPPGAPTVSSESGNGKVRLTWTAPEYDGTITAWQLRYGPVGGNSVVDWGEWTDIEGATAETTTYTVTGLTNGTSYRFELRAVAGEVAGTASDTASGSPTAGTQLSSTGVLTGFVLVDASTNSDLGAVIHNGTVLVKADGVYAVRAEVEANSNVGSVELTLQGPGEADEHERTENLAPYSLYGDDMQGAYNGEALAPGSYTLTATAYAERSGAGDELGTLTVPFTVALADPDSVRAGAVSLGAQSPDRGRQFYRDKSLDRTNGDAVDYYSFTTDGRYELGLGVRDQSIELKVVLEAADGTVVGTAGPPANPNLDQVHLEWLKQTIDAGTYYIRVKALEDGATDYYIRLGLKTPPPALAVADAQAQEGTDATLDFAVTLDKESTGTVTVEYATSDGTATAGSDYTAVSGTLTFAAGETEKTVSVPVLEDDHNEGSETLTLRLASPSGATIDDGEATGTITNSDAIPEAWLARFGRTVTGQVLDAVEQRLTGPRQAGVRASLAGQALPSWTPGSGLRSGAGGGTAAARSGSGSGTNPGAGSGTRPPGSGSGAGSRDPEAGAGPGAGDNAGPERLSVADSRSRDAMETVRNWMADADAGRSDAGGLRSGVLGGDNRSGFRSLALTPRDFLTGSSFALTVLTGGAKKGGYASLWGRGAIAGFDGREGDLSLDGEVTTGLIGADWASSPESGVGRWVAGLAIGHSTGSGGWRRGGECDPNCGGGIEATLTGLYPYAGMDLTDRLSVWAAAGYGAGEVTVTPDGGPGQTADLTMAMGAAGLRSQVLRPEDGDGLSLDFKGDARFTRTASDAVRSGGGNLEAAEADVWLIRAGVEGSRRFGLGNGTDGGASLTPSFEAGLRLDGGDAERGFGADLGGGLAFADPASGLRLDLKGRVLIAHSSAGFREWGASGALAWDPRPETDRGLSLSLRQSWGAAPAGGMDALLSRETLAGLAANDNPGSGAGAGGRFEASSRLEAEIGYGLATFGGAFTGTPNIGFGLSGGGGRDWRIGWRLTSAVSGDPGFEVNLDATRREPANDDGPEHGAMLRATVRW